MEILINKLEQNHSPGGLCGSNKIYVVEHHIAEPKLAFGNYLAAITHTGYDWQEINHAYRTAIFTEPQELIGGHLMHVAQLQISISKDEYTRVQSALSLTRKNWLVRFEDNNGIVKLMGARKAGANCTIPTRDNKRVMPERNEIILLFRVVSKDPTPEYPFDVD